MQHYLKMGCVTVTKQTDKRSRTVIIGCEEGFKYKNKNPMNNLRKTKTRALKSHYQIYCMLKNDFWSTISMNENYNHVLYGDTIGHPFSKRLKVEEKKEVVDLTKVHVIPINISSRITSNFKTIE